MVDPELLEVVEQGEGALNLAAGPAPGLIRGVPSGDLGCDPSSPGRAPVRVEVVAASAKKRRGRRRGRPGSPRIRGTASSRGMRWVTPWRFSLVRSMASGVPVGGEVVLIARAARSTGSACSLSTGLETTSRTESLRWRFSGRGGGLRLVMCSDQGARGHDEGRGSGSAA